MKNFLTLTFILALSAAAVYAQSDEPDSDAEKVQSIVSKAIGKLGGEKYKDVTSLSSSGTLSILQASKIASFQSFVDVVVYPDKERTDFSERGSKTIQVNTGDTGWIYNELFDKFGPQTDKQIENFKRGMLTHYDFLLRGSWKGNAELSYAGRRQSGIGRRNEVLRLEFEDDSWIEFEFSDEGLPMKTVYPAQNKEGALIREENRYAQFILTDSGILFPFIVDHFSDGNRSYRINYRKVRFNRKLSDSIFIKPANPKKIKKLKI